MCVCVCVLTIMTVIIMYELITVKKYILSFISLICVHVRCCWSGWSIDIYWIINILVTTDLNSSFDYSTYNIGIEVTIIKCVRITLYSVCICMQL